MPVRCWLHCSKAVWQLEAILVTHHHGDHTGGVDALRAATGAQVYGPARERMPEPLQRLHDGDRDSSAGAAL